MRTFGLASLATVALLSFTMPAIAEDAKQDFKLANKTGYEIKDVYVAPSKSDDWGDEVLGRGNRLGDGEAVNIHFSPKNTICKYDLKVVYSDDDSNAVWSNINLCETDKITIHYNRDKDETRATFD